METLEQKKRRLFGKQYLIRYLNELNKILLVNITESDLLTIVETDNVVMSTQNLKSKFLIQISFEDKAKLTDIVFNHLADTTERFYVITSLSKECGAVVINSLDKFNFSFHFNDEPTGLIIIVSQDLSQKLVLDFSILKAEKYLEIEVLNSFNNL